MPSKKRLGQKHGRYSLSDRLIGEYHTLCHGVVQLNVPLKEQHITNDSRLNLRRDMKPSKNRTSWIFTSLLLQLGDALL